MKKSAPLETKIRQPRAGIRKAAIHAVGFPKAVDLTLPSSRAPKGLEDHFAKNGEARAVCIEYFNTGAREVLVGGSFNGWQAHATPMAKRPGGTWSAQVFLKPGHYEYRLVVDGEWHDDPMAARFVANPFGGLNAVLEVKATAAPILARP